MHAYLVHANIMASVLKFHKGFNAHATETIMDRPALVRITQFQLELSALSREIRMYTRVVFVSVSVNSTFDINKRAHMTAYMHAVLLAGAHLHLYNNISIISDYSARVGFIISIA